MGKAGGRRIQGDIVTFEMEDGEVRGAFAEMNLVVGCRAYGIVAGLQPLETNEREPAIGF